MDLKHFLPFKKLYQTHFNAASSKITHSKSTFPYFHYSEKWFRPSESTLKYEIATLKCHLKLILSKKRKREKQVLECLGFILKTSQYSGA